MNSLLRVCFFKNVPNSAHIGTLRGLKTDIASREKMNLNGRNVFASDTKLRVSDLFGTPGVRKNGLEVLAE